MAKKLYVGNLPWSVSSSELQQMFAHFGEVVSAEIVADRNSGQSRGFGFVQMTDEAANTAAIDALHGTDCQGRPLVVNEAREPSPRGNSRGGKRRGGRGGGRPPRN